jgi:ElaB/YqjD/DUF883 family membrane-anchored ribosome-binding protein
MDTENQSTAVSPQARQKAERAGTHARKAAEDLASAAGGIWDNARDRVRDFQDDGKQYVRKNPTKAVFSALGVGFVLGLIFRR